MKNLARALLAILAVTTVTSEVDVVQGPEVCLSLPTGTGIVAHPIYCAFFYICSSGTPELHECPNGLYFNPVLVTCDYASSVPNCEGGTRPPSTTTTTVLPSIPSSLPPSSTTVITTPATESTVATTTTGTPGPEPTLGPSTTTVRPTTTVPVELYCPPTVEFIFMPYPRDCTKFYVCELGELMRVQSCSIGLWFNGDLQACMTPWTDSCPN